ncbi:hypothetical protein YC2023_051613 [Brassica napus]
MRYAKKKFVKKTISFKEPGNLNHYGNGYSNFLLSRLRENFPHFLLLEGEKFLKEIIYSPTSLFVRGDFPPVLRESRFWMVKWFKESYGPDSDSRVNALCLSESYNIPAHPSNYYKSHPQPSISPHSNSHAPKSLLKKERNLTMDSRTTSALAIFLILNILFFTTISACGNCGCPSPKPKPNSEPKPTPSPSPATAKCPRDALKLGVCANVLNGLLNVTLGQPPVEPCCTLIKGLADLEAAACLCTALKANILGNNLNIPISLNKLEDSRTKSKNPIRYESSSNLANRDQSKSRAGHRELPRERRPQTRENHQATMPSFVKPSSRLPPPFQLDMTVTPIEPKPHIEIADRKAANSPEDQPQ